ncbi:putative oxidoreductase [Flavobacterium segetis]|uniref:Putative oxidoreductase n=1 Tax=Flavobacterium segetis TaxID=271157 RepID=A0A1M5GB50_9FLAO|nr:DoxX family protein [Flavobacterium segetis]SHG00963.1 putative oxidoreductase [Flavobacterium segetis]
MKTGNIIIRIGFGLLFVWGGLEKFIEGFLGGVGLNNMAAFLKSSGFAFLGDSGTFLLGAFVALIELVAGLLLFANKKIFFAYALLTGIIVVALLSVHIPSGNWMNIMIHIALLTTLLGLAINHKDEIDT